MPGTHTLIQVPAGQISRVYSIKANAISVNTDSAIIASYYPFSNVRAVVTVDASGAMVGRRRNREPVDSNRRRDAKVIAATSAFSS